jgi:hypothetical protein
VKQVLIREVNGLANAWMDMEVLTLRFARRTAAF